MITTISAEQFARRLKTALEDQDCRFAYFMGAGCSISSGIPGATGLVKQWLPRLKVFETGTEKDLDVWAKSRYPDYDSSNLAAKYSDVFNDLFLTDEEGQKEIEKIVSFNDPAFGYAVLSQLLTNDTYGKHCNVVFTTNFDDLVADALYLFTNRKPLIISHESLIDFVRIGRTRPLVIKLHGDARLSPKNRRKDIEKLKESMAIMLKNLLGEMGLIFIGYGGNDPSITTILKDLPRSAIPWGIYWVGESFPQSPMGDWLTERNAILVKQFDFDELMLLIREEFHFEHPDEKRLGRIMVSYKETLGRLQKKIEAKTDSPEKKILEKAAEKAASEFKDWWAVELEAQKFVDLDPNRANDIYRAGLDKFNSSLELQTNYAYFLWKYLKDYDKAEEYYKRVIKTDPKNAYNFGNYGYLLYTIRRDYKGAEEYYKRAIDVNPRLAFVLNNYGLLMDDIRKDYDKAEEYYKRAIEVDPNLTDALSNYGLLLTNIRKDYDKAETYYKRAIEIDPNHADALNNYGLFWDYIRKDYNKAEEYYKRAIKADPKNAKRFEYYAIFLQSKREDFKKAVIYYKKSIGINPKQANALGNLAGILFSQGRVEEGTEFLKRAFESASETEKALILECWFYIYAHSNEYEKHSDALNNIKRFISEGTRSPNWSLEPNVKRAILDTHPEPEFLKVLADVIVDKAKVEELDKFPVWNNIKV
jgi:protein O-mannosyl-transferase